jgi:two-component system, OmpR family, phosphate regulon response regulator PhoB
VREEAQENPLVVICTSDIDLYLLLDHVLQAERFATQLAGGVDEIREIAATTEACAIFLDRRRQSGAAAGKLRALRQDSRIRSIPIIALIDQGAERDYVDLLKSGIDDIFIRPMLPAKLVERLIALVGDQSPGVPASARGPDVVHFADLEMDLITYRVRRGGRDIHLSPIEFRILRHLLRHPEQVATREELKNAAWQGNVHVGPRTIDVHVGRLRKALLSVSDRDLIRTVRSVGYALSIQQGGDDRHR